MGSWEVPTQRNGNRGALGDTLLQRKDCDRSPTSLGTAGVWAGPLGDAFLLKTMLRNV